MFDSRWTETFDTHPKLEFIKTESQQYFLHFFLETSDLNIHTKRYDIFFVMLLMDELHICAMQY